VEAFEKVQETNKKLKQKVK